MSQVSTVADTPRVALSVADAADSLGISRATAYNLMRDGRLPYVKLGRRRLVRTADLAAFLDGLTGSPAARA
jgi:excisionase family DNA binding protein